MTDIGINCCKCENIQGFCYLDWLIMVKDNRGRNKKKKKKK